MADITVWDPFAEVASLRQAMDEMFNDIRPRVVRRGATAANEGYFPVDLAETDNEFVVKASLPGVKPEDIDISVTGQVLSIKGTVNEEHEENTKNYYRRERRSGTFVRQLSLPEEVDSGRANASYENGVLRLALPKSEAAKPKTIKVAAQPAIESGAKA